MDEAIALEPKVIVDSIDDFFDVLKPSIGRLAREAEGFDHLHLGADIRVGSDAVAYPPRLQRRDCL